MTTQPIRQIGRNNCCRAIITVDNMKKQLNMPKFKNEDEEREF